MLEDGCADKMIASYLGTNQPFIALMRFKRILKRSLIFPLGIHDTRTSLALRSFLVPFANHGRAGVSTNTVDRKAQRMISSHTKEAPRLHRSRHRQI
jgi:hypothetical protein